MGRTPQGVMHRQVFSRSPMDVSLILCRCPRSLHHIPPTALALPFLHKIGVILCRRHWTDSLTYQPIYHLRNHCLIRSIIPSLYILSIISLFSPFIPCRCLPHIRPVASPNYIRTSLLHSNRTTVAQSHLAPFFPPSLRCHQCHSCNISLRPVACMSALGLKWSSRLLQGVGLSSARI